MKVEIRAAVQHECDYIRAIHQELKRPFRESYVPEEFLIAWQDKIAIGCAATAVHDTAGYLYGLAVRRDWQRRGVGGQLMEARLNGLRESKAEYAVALAMFWNSRFFRAHGFAPVKRSALPLSASFYPDLTNPFFRRSAVMLRFLNQAGGC